MCERERVSGGPWLSKQTLQPSAFAKLSHHDSALPKSPVSLVPDSWSQRDSRMEEGAGVLSAASGEHGRHGVIDMGCPGIDAIGDNAGKKANAQLCSRLQPITDKPHSLDHGGLEEGVVVE